jgi:hypothetical protein
MKEKSFWIFVWCHLWNARVSLEGADTTSYRLVSYWHWHHLYILLEFLATNYLSLPAIDCSA